MRPRSQRTGRMYAAVMISVILLLLVRIADALLLQPPWIITIVSILPLLVFVPGIRRDNLRSFIWLCFVSLLYFIALVERVFARPGDWVSVVGLVAVVILFCSGMLYVRWRAQELRTENSIEVAEHE